ncbi:hypothetical protein [Nocardia goodfellowii]|uniref:Membrane protein YjdF n=1 Tax=Nocardia goodfellowii TaxID=882446 RepID=A0ABS4Q651_9NOCA|nr:hypothetical protein [Nocardia goodfellowii]MBP2187169.1 putative membrane protein YjdF [Nocardia goodfellowii]
MQAESPNHRELIAALFADEFADGVDVAVLRRIHAGEFEEWRSALDRSGLFGKDALATIEEQWRADPEVLLDALLGAVDDVTRRRWLMAWSALDRPEPLGRIG